MSPVPRGPALRPFTARRSASRGGWLGPPLRPCAILAICLVLLGGTIRAQILDRVETGVAMAQLLKKVDPVIPPVAASARVGATVVADVTVGATGRVTNVSILAGADLLHAAATTALRSGPSSRSSSVARRGR